jgi:hypothetical protein
MRNGKQRMRGRGHRGKSQNPLTRVYESNGPDVKIRGTASHVAEKYIQLARDSQSSGDPVAAENYYQHAEHYFRLIAAANEQFRQQNPYYNQQPGQPQQGGMPQGAADNDYDDGDDEQPGNGQNEPYNPQQQQQPQAFQPREYQQPQPYQGQPQHQPQNQPQQQNYQPQQNMRPQNQPPQGGQESNDIGLPSFITGGAPQQQNPGQNNAGQNNNYGGQQNGNGQYDRNDRYGRHRRRRHRGPRQDFQGQPQQQGGQPQGNEGGPVGGGGGGGGGDEPHQPGE